MPITTRYVTLSHCWGEKEFFKLSQHNYSLLRQSIPVSSLKKTFQDAFFITLELGIAYIWIDSLCIVQDSRDEWLRESKRMGDVYCYAECNIAAAAHRDSTLGLFGERKSLPLVHPSLQLSITLFDRDREEKHYLNGFYTVADPEQFEFQMSQSILNSRAWVAQERALSPGVIHLMPEKIWWECNEMIADEAFFNRTLYDHVVAAQEIRSLKANQKDEIYRFWRRFVGRYAGTRITKREDRFPAAAGIARVAEEMLKENYIAGCWEGDLVPSLLWRRLSEVHDVPPIQHAPSWSWASMCGEVGGYGFNGNPRPIFGVEATVISDTLGFESDLKSLSVERSHVRGLAIRGPLRKLPPDLARDIPEYDEKITSVRVFHDKEYLDHVEVPESRAWALGESTHVLLLAKNDFYVFGLLLQEARASTEANTFRRSGYVEFFVGCPSMREYADDVDEYLGLLKRDGNYEPSLRFEECGLQNIVLI